MIPEINLGNILYIFWIGFIAITFMYGQKIQIFITITRLSRQLNRLNGTIAMYSSNREIQQFVPIFDNEFLDRNKQGFVFNVENWVYNNMNYLDSELRDSIVTSEYNKNILRSLSLNKTRINGIRIWKLFVLSQYMKRL